MRRTVGELTLTIMILGLLPAAAGALTIKLGSLAPNGSPWDNGLRQIAARWSQISAGKVVLKIYPGGIAGGEDDMIRKMRIGQLGAAGMTGVGLCRIYSGVLALHFPLTVRTDAELDYVLEKMKPRFEQHLEEKGFKVLIWTKVGWVHFYSREPVVTPADLRKQKMFIYAGDSDGEQAWKDGGFHTVPLSPTDLTASLQTGMVDAYSSTPLSVASYQWFTQTKYMCGMRWAPLVGGIVITTATWEKIPADLRPRLLEACSAIGASMQKDIDAADAQAVEMMKKQGLQVTETTDEAVALWREASAKGFGRVIGKSFDQESYDLVLKYLAEYREANAGK